VLARCAELQRAGVEVVPQVACRPLNFEFQWKAPFPFESMSLFRSVSAGDDAEKKRIYGDPAFRAAFRDRLGRGDLPMRLATAVIVEYGPDPTLAEQSLAAVAAARGVDPVDLALDLGLTSDLEARFRLALLNTDEAAVGEMLRHPATLLGL